MNTKCGETGKMSIKFATEGKGVRAEFLLQEFAQYVALYCKIKQVSLFSQRVRSCIQDLS